MTRACLVFAAAALAACTQPASTCPAGQSLCGTACATLASDRANCGECGKGCDPGQICQSGACALSCVAGQIACGGACIDPQTDRAHCGATGDCAGANDGEACAAGKICANGACALSCVEGQIACGGACVDPKTSRAFCGASGDCAGANDGEACATGQICDDGHCVGSCGAGRVACGGACVDPQSDPQHCGAGADCDNDPGANCATGAPAGSAGSCIGGVCRYTCLANRWDCDGYASNGCESQQRCAGACEYRESEHPNYTTAALDAALCGATYDHTNIATACNPGWHVCKLSEWQARYPAGVYPNSPISTWGADQTIRCKAYEWEARRPENGEKWDSTVCPADVGAATMDNGAAYLPWNNTKNLFANDGTTILWGNDGDCCNWDSVFTAPPENQGTEGYAVYCCKD